MNVWCRGVAAVNVQSAKVTAASAVAISLSSAMVGSTRLHLSVLVSCSLSVVSFTRLGVVIWFLIGLCCVYLAGCVVCVCMSGCLGC